MSYPPSPPPIPQEPLPVAPLSYSSEEDDGWAFVLRVAAVAAIALGTCQSAYSLASFVPALMNPSRAFPGGLGLRGIGALETLVVLMELALMAAGVGLIVAGAGCRGLRPWAAGLLIASAAVIGLGAVLQWLLRTAEVLPRISGSGSTMGVSFTTYYLVTGVPAVARGLILPALLIWLITRPPVRRLLPPRADAW